MNTEIILVTPPEQIKNALLLSVPVAHMAYRIGKDLQLYRASIPINLKGGYMILSDFGYEGSGCGNTEVFIRQICRECAARGYAGVVADFENLQSPFLYSLVANLSAALHRQELSFFVPESFAGASKTALVIISSAISVGTLKKRLEEALDKYDGRVAVEMQRIFMEFTLPSYNGSGRHLTREEFLEIFERHAPQPFFSQEFCAYYFTYQNKTGSHFLLYDNAASFRKKLFTASELGIAHAFLFYPEVEEFIADIL